jgi:hypothetical protein
MAFCCGLVYARVGEGGGNLWERRGGMEESDLVASPAAFDSDARFARAGYGTEKGLRVWVRLRDSGVLALRQAQGQDDGRFGWDGRWVGVVGLVARYPLIAKCAMGGAPGGVCNGWLKLSAVWVILEESNSVASPAAALRPAAARCALCAGCLWHGDLRLKPWATSRAPSRVWWGT